ncbi:MAG: hypothetical protein ABIU54_06695 [Candidatus Eisenbacteria bacterium]
MKSSVELDSGESVPRGDDPDQLGHDNAPDRASEQARVDGRIFVYRQYDVGHAVDLARTCELLATSSPDRSGHSSGGAQASQIAVVPVTVPLPSEPHKVGTRLLPSTCSARIFDFAVVSLRIELQLPADMPWSEFADSGNRVDLVRDLAPVLDGHLKTLIEQIGPAIKRAQLAPVTEDYVVFRIDALRDGVGHPLDTNRLVDQDMVLLLLDEHRPLAPEALHELLPHRFSYFADDLALLTWNNALVVEPDAKNSSVQDVLEFANAQLLELRVYDAILDLELPKMVARINAARGRSGYRVGRRFAPLLGQLQSLVGNASETVERIENSLRVTDDVYLARIYAAALEVFRGRAWRTGIDRKLATLRETYKMLNLEAQAARSEVLELTVVGLILVELVLAVLQR